MAGFVVMDRQKSVPMLWSSLSSNCVAPFEGSLASTLVHPPRSKKLKIDMTVE